MKSERNWLTRFLILRMVGVIYGVAFLVAVRQILPLIGSKGLTPVGPYLKRVSRVLGSQRAAIRRLPSLFWYRHSDKALLTVSWTGLVLSCVVIAGYANVPLLIALWVLYLSIVHVGQEWYGYGWESQLTETGFLAIFLCPLLDMHPFPRNAPPLPIIVLFRWLIFRIMLGSGLIKIRGNVVWREGTALYYHFETQPIPNPLSRWFHFLPRPVLKMGVWFNHLAELGAPWFVFWPRLARQVAGAVIVIFQGSIILSGNLSILNWLTIIPGLACMDDGFWAKVLPRWLVRKAQIATVQARVSIPQQVTAYIVMAVVGFLSYRPVKNLASRRQVMNTSFNPLRLVNTYGAFGTVGKERFNVVFEGTSDEYPSDRADWKPYIYKGLPVALDKRPPQIAPYQLRLDWQMWFAAMGSPNRYPWTLHLVWKLLHNDPGAVGLFAVNPFPDKPPRYIRAVLYHYCFAPPGNPEGLWWDREPIELWLPAMSADDPRLLGYLKIEGWVV
ncbi:lipase maturation factor family protein [Chitinophagaceae bacterium LB-8]|uniref:Lipase maturation factor family protein n=1 Tax=Paraflavisolibacter caeni TaxID=2982496 RepID=A0A9X2XTD4_9BACT|nr:lipase maturation factor family protein [Paraflavisolibacter caeni]MCU7547967.1 lipase maturation factor family protein [Paraflavisolibacter caeni]